jgi:hypothetical protein
VTTVYCLFIPEREYDEGVHYNLEGAFASKAGALQAIARLEEARQGQPEHLRLFADGRDVFMEWRSHPSMSPENSWTYLGSRDDCDKEDHAGGYVVEEVEVWP